MCDMTHPYVWHDSFICVTWLIHMFDMTQLYVWHDSFICVTWLIYMCDMTNSYVNALTTYCNTLQHSPSHGEQDYRVNSTAPCMWYDSFICLIWLIHMCDMTNSYDMTHLYVWHDSFICQCTANILQHSATLCITWVTGLPGTYIVPHLARDMTHSYFVIWLIYISTHCQHTATHCDTLQHTATHCNSTRILCPLWCSG